MGLTSTEVALAAVRDGPGSNVNASILSQTTGTLNQHSLFNKNYDN